MLSRLMTRREQFVVGFLGLAIVAGAAALFFVNRAHTEPPPLKVQPMQAPVRALQASTPAAPVKAAEPEPPAPTAPKEVVVSVRGAVVLPGVYRLEEGSRVTDLVKAAGGLTRADVADINFAARLIDGTTLTVPARKDDTTDPRAAPAPVVANPAAYTISGQSAATPAGAQTAKSAGPVSGRINLNTATQAELESLPGIGPHFAKQIIQYRSTRRFGATTDLMAVPGIGKQRFEAIRDLITVK